MGIGRPPGTCWGVLACAVLALLALACSRGQSSSASPPKEIILATTTSTKDTGLLDVLLPRFEQVHGIRVKPIAVGTGEALAMGARGDADVLLVHSRKAEDAFMQQGNGSLRLDVMHNDFLLMGPAADPAGAKGKGVLEALTLIAASASPFVSRADQSGTHKKELELWAKAGVATEGASFLVRTGQGMGESARVASEKRAYTLIDRATFLAQKRTLELVPIAEGEPLLLNPYGVIVVSAAKQPKVHEAEATTFARWLCTPEAQKLIGEFGVDQYGGQLYVPDAVPGGAK
jgi:tungstate transport system substrate-binding protein